MQQPPAPKALLYIGTGCAHCQTVLDGLARLVKEGKLARLEIVNLSADPESAPSTVRTVPWIRIGDFQFDGLIPPEDLADWVGFAVAGEGRTAYYAHLLEHRRLEEVAAAVREHPSGLADLLSLLTNEGTSMATRIGVSAVIEELSGSKALRAVIPELEQLTLSEIHQTRADACYFLGLTGDRRVTPIVARLLDDEQPDVREIAMETLALLGEPGEPRRGEDS